MRTTLKRPVCRIALAVLLLTTSPPITVAGTGAGAARLDGSVLDVGGAPAAGFTVHLIDERGVAVGQARTSADGAYAFPELARGTYSLGVENAAGAVAPVAGPPIRLTAGQSTRGDITLTGADPAGRDRALDANPAVGVWWAGLTTGAKVWTVLGAIAIVGITFAALDDSNDESPASPF